MLLEPKYLTLTDRSGSLRARENRVARAPRAPWKIRRAALLAGVSLAALSGFVAVGALRSAAPTDDPGASSSDETVIAVAQTVNPPQPVVEAPPVEQNWSRTTRLGRGGTLSAALERLEVDDDLRTPVLVALTDALDSRRLSPETGLHATHDSRGLRSLAVRHEASRYLRITLHRGASGPRLITELLRLPVETAVEDTGVVVSRSVAQALSANEHGQALTEAFVGVFQWDVDMLVDPRPGDEIRIVYEVHRLGLPPEDLPEFADSAHEHGDFVGLGRILAASYSGAMVSSSAFWVHDRDGWGNYYDAEGTPLRKSFLRSPLNHTRISSGFSQARRHPVTRKVVPHHGIDFAAPSGTPIVSTAEGRVVSVGWAGALGRTVKIRHNTQYTTLYGHMSRFAAGIRAGVDVRQNQVIGYVGATGRATGPHLHYTMLSHGRPIDPFRMKNPPAQRLSANQRPWLDDALERWNPVLETVQLELPPFEVADGRATGRGGPGV